MPTAIPPIKIHRATAAKRERRAVVKQIGIRQYKKRIRIFRSAHPEVK